jgi:hypothetical protein
MALFFVVLPTNRFSAVEVENALVSSLLAL